jgi:rRNA maturation RNase YbeY
MATVEYPNLAISGNGTLPSVPFLAIKELVLGKKYDLSVSFVSPAVAQHINIERRGKEYIPNTLSFSLTNTSGEIIMCRSAIKTQYKEFGMDHDTYLVFLLIHSMLHLKGYEHGATMEKAEARYLARFKASLTHEASHNRRH